MEFTFVKIYELEYAATVEADSYEEALELLEEDCFDECDKPYMTRSYATDEEGNEYEYEPY